MQPAQLESFMRCRRALVEAWVKGGARLLLCFLGFYRITTKGRDNLKMAQVGTNMQAVLVEQDYPLLRNTCPHCLA